MTMHGCTRLLATLFICGLWPFLNLLNLLNLLNPINPINPIDPINPINLFSLSLSVSLARPAFCGRGRGPFRRAAGSPLRPVRHHAGLRGGPRWSATSARPSVPVLRREADFDVLARQTALHVA